MKRADYISEYRVKSMQKGAHLFVKRWRDLFEQGLERLLTNSRPMEMIAEQQVNAGNGHIARQLRLAKRELSADLNPNWLDRVCQSLIIARALQTLDAYNLWQQLDILTQAGLQQQKKWLASLPAGKDDFIVLSSKTQVLENLHQRTTYLQRIKDGALAQSIRYWHVSEKGPQDISTVGQTVELKYRFYPSAQPLRVEIEHVHSRRDETYQLKGLENWETWQTQIKSHVTRDPWLSNRPFVLKNMRVECIDKLHVLIDSQKSGQMYFRTPYDAMTCAAFSSKKPINLFATCQAGHISLHSAFRDGVGMPFSKQIILQSKHPTYPMNIQTELKKLIKHP
jgi:hypothetical protein